MKTYCKHLEIDETIVNKAIDEWLSRESGKKNKWRIVDEFGSRESLVSEIVEEVRSRNLKFVPIRYFSQTESINGKQRRIGIESIKQQICGYIIYVAAHDLFANRVGNYQMSSIKGRGQLKSAKRIKAWLRQSTSKYWIHADVRKCYPSLSHEVVRSVYRKYIGSEDVLYVIDSILDTYDIGLNIGSFFSLKTAQLVLSFGYHFVEELHKRRRGYSMKMVEHQLWYADDIYFIGPNKRMIASAMRMLQQYLLDSFGLEIKPWKVCKVSKDEPIDISGYSVSRDKMNIKDKIFLRARRMLAKFSRSPTFTRAASICSYWGWFKHGTCYRFVSESNIISTIRKARSMVSRSMTRRPQWQL